MVTGKTQNGKLEVEMRNRFKVGDELEILSPNENFNKKFIIESIENQNGEQVEDAKNVQEKYVINCPFDLNPFDILRK